MEHSEIAFRRLQNHQIIHSDCQAAEELVHWMGAMQAQDYEMSKWAIGVRLPGSTRKQIERAISDGSIIRTHLLRPTWHFVAAKDLRWILQVSTPRVRVALRSRQKQLGLTKDLIFKSNSVLEKALTDSTQMTRSELVCTLENSGFKNEDNLASHLLICAELDEVICSGPSDGKNYTYALFKDRIPSGEKLDLDEALAKLAGMYFRSHGPATLEDFIWWSGLTKTGAKKAVNLIKDNLHSDEIEAEIYWFVEETDSKNPNDESVHLLPSYDEYLISYRNRTAIIKRKHKKKAISNNGIFRPIIVKNGEIIGIWKRSEKGSTLYVETEYFLDPSKETMNQAEETAKTFADFLEKDLKITQVIE